MIIKQDLLTRNDFSRPGSKIKKVKGIVIHWTANPKSSAKGNRDFFENRKLGKTGFGSAHYIIGLQGEVIQCIPDNELSYHVGANTYKDGVSQKLSTYPNNCSIGIECCHLDWEGNFTPETYQSMIELTRKLLEIHGLTIENLYRHYDIGSQQYDFRGKVYTGKPCPYLFVKDESLWLKFLEDVKIT